MANQPRSKRGQSPNGSELVPVLAVRDAVHFPGLINTLHVVREASLKALRSTMAGSRRVLVLSQRDMSVEEPTAADLFQIGTLSEALQAIPLPDTSLRVALRGLRRVRAVNVMVKGGSLWAEVQEVEEIQSDNIETEALMRACVECFTRVVQLNKDVPPEALQGIAQIDSAGLLADGIVHHLPIRPLQKQDLLEELDHNKRLSMVLNILSREQQVLDLNSTIHKRVEKELGESQREFYLREQLKIIESELEEREDRIGETEDYRNRIERSGMPPEAIERALLELKRLDRSPPASPEGMVVRNYLDTLVNLPWATLTEDQLDVQAAAELLEKCHFGLERVKDRILDQLAVRQLRKSMRGPILCFVGPPGVGKTSIARSIAEAMGRKFVRIALGGVRDEAEIRGHRRTYIGSLPGRIMQGLKDCGARNPVILLDEVDKVAAGSQGDPTSALLEALDTEQNSRFVDHYIETPFDLSAVLFIATANLMENVPAALRDRMEVISFGSYTQEERREIGQQFLLPRAKEENGLAPNDIVVTAETLDRLIEDYTREAGVRSLDRQLMSLCRKAARQVAEGAATPILIDPETAQRYLGRPRHARASQDLDPQIGVAWGLVVSEAGGETVAVEVSLSEPFGSRPELWLTGNLGDVMKESVQAALSSVRSQIPEAAKAMDVHVHLPAAAIPKDGPSAGVTVAVALASAFQNRQVRGDVAMTGEITLRGRVLPVGGVRDKLLAALAAGKRIVILPADNAPDLEEVPETALHQLDVRLVNTAAEAFEIALM